MRKHIMLALGATALGLIGQAQAATVTFSSISLGVAGPGTGNLNLGIFVTGNTQFEASGSTTLFDTNMGMAANSKAAVSGKGTLTGKLYKDPTANSGAFGTQFYVNGGIVTRAMADAVTAVKTANTNAATLAANITYASIGGSALTITDSSGVANTVGGKNTVVKVTNNININSSSKNLTINGTSKDWFIINVPTVTVSAGSILLSGGITADHVLFNLTGTGGNQLKVTNSASTLYGTYLAPQNINNSNIQSIDVEKGTINGAIIGYEVQTKDGVRVNGRPYISVPVPAAAWLFGSALGLLGMTRRKQHSA